MWQQIKKILNRSFVVFTVVFLIYYVTVVIISAKTLVMSGDITEYYNNIYSVIHGRKPYQDFWLLFAPLEVYFPSLFATLLGYNIIAWGIVIAPLLNSVLVYLLLKRLSTHTLLNIILSFLFSLWASEFLYFGICLLSLHSFLYFGSKSQKIFLILSGLLSGIALLFRIYHVAPLIITIYISLLFIDAISKKKKIETLFIYSISLLIPNLICYVFLQVNINTVFTSIIKDSVLHGTSMNYPYWFGFIDSYKKIFIYYQYFLVDSKAYDIKGIVFMITDSIYNLILRITPLIGIILISIDYKVSRIKENQSLKILLFMWGIFFIPYAFNLSEEQHFKQAYSPFMILIFLYILENRLKIITSISLALILFLSFLNIYSYIKPSKSNFYSFSYNNITYTTSNEENYKQQNDLVKTILENTNSNDNIFCLAWNIIPINLFCSRINRTYYDSPIDILINPSLEKETQLIKDINSTKTKIIVIERGDIMQSFYHYSFENRNPGLITYIKSHYHVLKQIGIYDIYIINNNF